MRRIGIDAHVLGGKPQGSRTWLENVLHAIGRQDGENRYILYSFSPEKTRRNFPYLCFDHRPIAVHQPALRLLAFWPWIIFRDRLDALLTQYNAPPFAPGVHFVVIHDVLYESHPRIFPALMRWRLKVLCRLSAWRARKVFTVSSYCRDELTRRYRIPPERIVVAYCGAPAPVEPTSLALEYAAALKPYLLCVGRLEPRKNITLAIRATTCARAAGVRLIVVGREDFSAAEILRAINAAEGVVHLSDVDADQLTALYREAEALIFPSLGEGFGLPVIEALAQGTPVIASDRTAIPEVGGPFARYFDPTSSTAEPDLALLIDEALVGRRLVHPAALQAHLARFDWACSGQAIIDAVNALE